MEGNIAAAIALEDLDSAGGQRLRGSEDMSSFGVASESNNSRMLEQQQRIAYFTQFAQIDQFPLQAQPFAIINPPELDHGNHSVGKL